MICGKCLNYRSKKYDDIKIHQSTRECEKYDTWCKIAEARKSGQDGAADKLLRKALGIKTEMSEETKQKLKSYYEEQKEEINLARKLKKASQKRYGL